MENSLDAVIVEIVVVGVSNGIADCWHFGIVFDTVAVEVALFALFRFCYAIV